MLGASTLYTAPGSPAAPDVAVAAPIIAVMAGLTALFMAVAFLTIVRVRRRTLAFAGVYGAGGTMSVPPGSDGVVKTTLAPFGVVHAAGEEWTARSSDGQTIAEGRRVRVVGQDGLTLMVEPGPPVDEGVHM